MPRSSAVLRSALLKSDLDSCTCSMMESGMSSMRWIAEEAFSADCIAD